MINHLIRFSLANRPLILGLAIIILLMAVILGRQLPVDVLPDLTRPTVTLLTESSGMSPEEVERMVTIPIENAVSGAPDIVRLRSESHPGLSMIFVEFDWGTDIYHARQIVQERLQAINVLLPDNVQPHMGPVSSLLGEIMLVGFFSENPEINSLELRRQLDQTVVRRLQSIHGVAQVLAIGGGIRQLQVLADPEKMAMHGVSLAAVQEAAAGAAADTHSGFVSDGSQERVIRNLGMTLDLEEFSSTPLSINRGVPLQMGDVADIRFGPSIMRGDAGVNGHSGVILSIHKSPGVDTMELSNRVEQALSDLRPSLADGVHAEVLFRQADFIENAVANLYEALRDGAIMVTIILFLFLLNIRTTLITLTAIPLSFAITIIIFHLLGIGINTMTLGGIAVAIGLVVDDAIVDVENVFRRLRENRQLSEPRPVIDVVADASIEVRSAILYATLLIALVFLPLFALSGMEGQLFAPIAMATILSMLASFIVAITIVPVLASFILPGMKRMRHTKDGWLVAAIKKVAECCFVRPSLRYPFPTLALTSIGVAFSFALWPTMGKSFLPQFNEGSSITSMVAAPGTSLELSRQLGKAGEQLLLEIPDIRSVGRRTGRAELDEHVMPVNVNEFDIEFHSSRRPLNLIAADIREKLSRLPGVYVNVGQPISHRIDHMLAGTEAQIVVKVHGEDLDELRAQALRIEERMQSIRGLADIQVERQLRIPQIHIIPDREALAGFNLRAGSLNEWLAQAVGGRSVAQIRDNQLPMDVFVRLTEEARSDAAKLSELRIDHEHGNSVVLGDLARIRHSDGPNRIQREDGSRRIFVSANSDGTRDLVSTVEELRANLIGMNLPEGYYLSFAGQYASQQAATQRMLWLALITLIAMTFLLYGYYRQGVLVLQTLINVPLACAGALVLTWLTIGEISLATLIGLVALAGIASRNTILMISHYIHLMRFEGEGFTSKMVVRGTLERLVPVTMTALTAGMALLPLAMAADAPGKEILHPVAIAIIGGLVTSTLLDLIVTPTVFYHFTSKRTYKDF